MLTLSFYNIFALFVFVLFLGNKLGDTGLQMLSKILDTIPSLISLDISCNGITSVGLMELKNSIEPANTSSNSPELGLMAFSQKPLQVKKSIFIIDFIIKSLAVHLNFYI